MSQAKKSLEAMPGAPPSYLKKKTMIKDRVGEVRSTSYVLPTTGHVYGKACQRDGEGAGEVLTMWVAATPSQPKESQRSFVKTNKKALLEGCITAEAQRVYAQDHPNIRFKQVSGKKAESVSVPYQGPFGIGTSGKDESIRPLIEVDYTSFNQDGADYPDLSRLSKKGRLPPPKATIASMGHDVRQRPVEEPKEPWVMRKFQNVKATQ
eukprot:CAMPEP_0182573120 /NCGR_PEP_ID=MMETSP1324-20130603/18261_1 /TAXON_ID=236786 /ORGANISM="Florenciella sp., Strain RCC1587" /LENGTH=207 /DNA_ID=CAMNT_0024788165 /DNA_START=39 /DNA_END=662 /DNA_ORIENTATION=+